MLNQSTDAVPTSIGAESLGNLNEALARIAAGKLPLEQLSPLHRVMFGACSAPRRWTRPGSLRHGQPRSPLPKIRGTVAWSRAMK
jgi:hypothetical protein